MADRTLGPEVIATVDAFAASMPKSEFAGPLVDLVRQVYRPDATMAGAFEELLAGLFNSFELVLVNGAHPSLKNAARTVFRHEVEHSAEHGALLARRAKALQDLGYHAQVPISSDAANIFFHGDEGRERLVREDGTWILRRTKRRFDDAELQKLLLTTPERFSPNVLLRPVVESKLFPTIAYVGGPAEISYFAEIGCLFRAHDVEPPVVFPRINVTLVEARVRKVLDKFSLSSTDFHRPFHEVVAGVLRDGMPEDVTSALDTLRTAVQTGYDRLQEAAVRIDPTLGGWIEGVRNGALGNVDGAAKKIASHFRKRHETEVEQLRKAWVHLYPDGELQERVLSPMPYVARYGTTLLDDILGAMRVQLTVPNPGWTGVRCED
jgi:bacillithiol biosynthesis cysteine-adding enzyme BshC